MDPKLIVCRCKVYNLTKFCISLQSVLDARWGRDAVLMSQGVRNTLKDQISLALQNVYRHIWDLNVILFSLFAVAIL